MGEKILEAFRKKKAFNMLELVMTLQTDENLIKEALEALVNCGKVRVEKKFSHMDTARRNVLLGSRCTIRGVRSLTYYMLNE